MDLLERLISIYEENEEKTIDEVLQLYFDKSKNTSAETA